MGECILPYMPMALTCSSDGYSAIEALGKPAVTEMLLDWLDPVLTVEEQEWLLGWHTGGSRKWKPPQKSPRDDSPKQEYGPQVGVINYLR